MLPHEALPNAWVTPSLSFQFHYFALRKMHFLIRARAVAVFPGGFGTFDECFELLTLVQTGKVAPMPILFFGEEFWRKVVNFEALVDEGVIAERDLELFSFVETADEAWAKIRNHYPLIPSPRRERVRVRLGLPECSLTLDPLTPPSPRRG